MIKPNKFKMKADRVLRGETYAKAGDIVYDFGRYDYGCASDDTRFTGIEHKSVTLDPDGAYPFFTVPCKDLEEIKE